MIITFTYPVDSCWAENNSIAPVKSPQRLLTRDGFVLGASRHLFQLKPCQKLELTACCEVALSRLGKGVYILDDLQHSHGAGWRVQCHRALVHGYVAGPRDLVGGWSSYGCFQVWRYIIHAVCIWLMGRKRRKSSSYLIKRCSLLLTSSSDFFFFFFALFRYWKWQHTMNKHTVGLHGLKTLYNLLEERPKVCHGNTEY